MNTKYKVLKYKSSKSNEIEDSISIEEPLEISIKFKKNGAFHKSIISITMRTPGHDEDLVRGFLFNERIIEKNENIENIENVGEVVGQYNLKNKILITTIFVGIFVDLSTQLKLNIFCWCLAQ